jgi:hypothetical protein
MPIWLSELVSLRLLALVRNKLNEITFDPSFIIGLFLAVYMVLE